jgi:hypothetical protein
VRDTEIEFGYALTGTVDPAAADDVRAARIGLVVVPGSKLVPQDAGTAFSVLVPFWQQPS